MMRPSNKVLAKKYLPLALGIILYIFIYFLRFQQGGWDTKLDLFQDLRSDLDSVILKHFPSPQAQLLSGIILGQKKELPAEFKLALRDTSTLHIVVVSGQNLTLLIGWILALSGIIRRKPAILISFSIMVIYTILTGAQIPILRAFIMVGLAMFAQALGRDNDAIWFLSFAALFMLLLNPKWIFDLSFQLSFLATTGVVVVAPILFKYLEKLPIIGQDLAVTLSAQALVIPVIASNFHQLSQVSLITNVLILWTVPIIMALGIIFLAVSYLIPPLAFLISFILNILLTYFIYIVEFFASLPFAWEYVGEFSWIFWVGYYLLIAAVLKLLYDSQQP